MMQPNFLPPQRRHYFAGVLMEANSAPLEGIYQTALMIVNDDDPQHHTKHLVYIVHGRGDKGAASSQALHRALEVGRRYFGSATLHKTGDLYDHLAGDVTLAVDMRRPILARPQGIEVVPC